MLSEREAAAPPAITVEAPAPSRSWTALLQPTLLPDHYAPLHGLRVIAVVLIVQLHATLALFDLDVISFTTGRVWFAMDLFFFLSGFLIGSILLVESRAGRRADVVRFYLRRSFRIIPPYLVVLTALALIGDHAPAQRANLWTEYVYLTNYVPPLPKLVVMPWAWSLAVEEHFYLVVPLLIGALRWVGSRGRQLLWLAVLWSSAPVVRGFTYAVGGPWTGDSMMNVIYVQSHLRYDILVAGIFIACVQHHHRDALVRLFQRAAARRLAAGVSALSFVLLLLPELLPMPTHVAILLCWGTLTSVAYAPLVLLVLNYESGLSRMLSRCVFRAIATFGYGIYLIHIPVIWMLVLPIGAALVVPVHPPLAVIWLYVVIGAIAASTLGGYLIHMSIEKPMLGLRDRVSP